jgi:hypothetical protein
MKRLLVVLALASVVSVTNRAAPEMTTLAVPGRSNANVSMASNGTSVVAVWSASLPSGATDIYASVSRDSGRTFSAPVRVNSTDGDARVSGEQPPRVTLAVRPGTTPQITAVWTSKGNDGTTILYARSDNGGRTFSRAAIVPGGDAAGNRGWENITTDANGHTRVVWLDHREMAAASDAAMNGHTHAGHDASPAAKQDGAAMAQQSKLYFATVGDPSSPRSITGGVCYCCKTAIVTGKDGSIYLAWRHVYPGNLRDMAFTMSRNNGQTFAPPIRVSEDRWEIEGCPDDGPAMAVDARSQVHVAWPTLVSDGPNGQPSIGIFYAMSGDGHAFSPRLRMLTEGLPHHPQIVVGLNRLFVAWDELQQGKRRIVVAQRPLGGAAGTVFTRSVVNGDEAGLYPALVPAASGVLIAWSGGAGEASVIRVARLP